MNGRGRRAAPALDPITAAGSRLPAGRAAAQRAGIHNKRSSEAKLRLLPQEQCIPAEPGLHAGEIGRRCCCACVHQAPSYKWRAAGVDRWMVCRPQSGVGPRDAGGVAADAGYGAADGGAAGSGRRRRPPHRVHLPQVRAPPLQGLRVAYVAEH